LITKICCIWTFKWRKDKNSSLWSCIKWCEFV